MIVVCFDGSEDATAAADQAIRLFPGKPATVLTVWEPSAETIVSSEMGLASGFGLDYNALDDTTDVDAALREHARRTAQEGAERLRGAGMGAEPLVEERDGSIARTVLEVAQRVDAEAVVVGTRGLGGVKSAFLGSVSHELVQHAGRTIVVVPSAALAHRREGWLPRSGLGCRGS
jgi:nucleotide-binding universal stress UspA family protein